MYTNIDLADLKHALSEIYRLAFKHLSDHPQDPATILKFILLSPTKGESRFSHRVPRGGNIKYDNRTGGLKGSLFEFCINERILRTWTNFLIDNIYIAIGTDLILKQVIGIPMGIQPAVFFANFFMFYYELDFARRVVAARRIDVIHHFRFTARFVDDIVALNNKMLTQYLYVNMSAGGIRGIYPTCIRVTLEQYSFISLNYLDITIFRDPCGVWHTKIYNKRHHAPLNKIKHITFPHIESYISRSCKFDIVTSQLTRFFRICSRKPDFLRVTLDFIEVLARTRVKCTPFTY